MFEVSIINTYDLKKVAEGEQLPQTTSEELENAFMPFFQNASNLIEKSKGIKVESLNQSKEMGEARAARLALKDIRVNVEKTRKALKENSLRMGRAIDGMANILKMKIEPVEEYLEAQEKYGELLAAKARAALRSERELQAGNYLTDFPQSVDLGAIDEYEFEKLLKFATAQYDAREETAQRLEMERIEREQREAAERAAMQAENDRLRKENEQREAALQAERAEIERLRREHEAELTQQKAAADLLRSQSEAKERADRERFQIEYDAKIAAEKAAAEAPDMEKLQQFRLVLFNITFPKMSTEAGVNKIEMAKSFLKKAIDALN